MPLDLIVTEYQPPVQGLVQIEHEPILTILPFSGVPTSATNVAIQTIHHADGSITNVMYPNGRILTGMTSVIPWVSVNCTSSTTMPVYHTTATTATTDIHCVAVTTYTDGSVQYHSPIPWYTNVTGSVTPWSEVREMVRPKVEKTIRNSIKRSLKLISNMGFEEDVGIFLKGDSIEVAHPDSLFKFVITKYAGSLIDRTRRPGCSTPYRLELYTKSDIHIANLCVYMDKTPVLDQVLGVALFIKSGNEEDILKKANWSCLNREQEIREIIALEYPYLENKMRLNMRTMESAEYGTVWW